MILGRGLIQAHKQHGSLICAQSCGLEPVLKTQHMSQAGVLGVAVNPPACSNGGKQKVERAGTTYFSENTADLIECGEFQLVQLSRDVRVIQINKWEICDAQLGILISLFFISAGLNPQDGACLGSGKKIKNKKSSRSIWRSPVGLVAGAFDSTQRPAAA